MTTIRLDDPTETFNMSFYMTYLVRWPNYLHVAEAPAKRIMGYMTTYFVDLVVKYEKVMA